MRRRLHQIIEDFKRRRNLDLYATTAVAFVFAALLVVGADLPESVRWSLLFAALGFVLLRMAFAGHRDERFLDRSDFDRRPIREDLRSAKEVWIFAPVGTNFLTEERCNLLRAGPLAHPEGKVRIVVLKQFEPGDAISGQLDALLDYPVQSAADSLRETHKRLAGMQNWQVNGTFAYGQIAVNPGFSFVAVDPHGKGGFARVEFHGFRNDAVGSRMHVRLTRDDGQWYTYWLDQFEAIWRSALTIEP